MPCKICVFCDVNSVHWWHTHTAWWPDKTQSFWYRWWSTEQKVRQSVWFQFILPLYQIHSSQLNIFSDCLNFPPVNHRLNQKFRLSTPPGIVCMNNTLDTIHGPRSIFCLVSLYFWRCLCIICFIATSERFFAMGRTTNDAMRNVLLLFFSLVCQKDFLIASHCVDVWFCDLRKKAFLNESITNRMDLIMEH